MTRYQASASGSNNSRTAILHSTRAQAGLAGHTSSPGGGLPNNRYPESLAFGHMPLQPPHAGQQLRTTPHSLGLLARRPKNVNHHSSSPSPPPDRRRNNAGSDSGTSLPLLPRPRPRKIQRRDSVSAFEDNRRGRQRQGQGEQQHQPPIPAVTSSPTPSSSGNNNACGQATPPEAKKANNSKSSSSKNNNNNNGGSPMQATAGPSVQHNQNNRQARSSSSLPPPPPSVTFSAAVPPTIPKLPPGSRSSRLAEDQQVHRGKRTTRSGEVGGADPASFAPEAPARQNERAHSGHQHSHSSPSVIASASQEAVTSGQRPATTSAPRSSPPQQSSHQQLIRLASSPSRPRSRLITIEEVPSGASELSGMPTRRLLGHLAVVLQQAQATLSQRHELQRCGDGDSSRTNPSLHNLNRGRLADVFDHFGRCQMDALLVHAEICVDLRAVRGISVSLM